MNVTLPGIQPDTALSAAEQQQFEEVVADVVFEVSIKRDTPSLGDIEISPRFRYNPVFLREYPVQGRADKTLAKLVTATETILAHPRLGLNAIRTGWIASIAGVSIGTFYRYFEDEIAILDYVFPERVVYLPQGS